jgi:hypothetical protein
MLLEDERHSVPGLAAIGMKRGESIATLAVARDRCQRSARPGDARALAINLLKLFDKLPILQAPGRIPSEGLTTHRYQVTMYAWRRRRRARGAH